MLSCLWPPCTEGVGGGGRAGLSKPRFRKGRKRTEASLEKWAVTLGLETWVRKRPSFSLTLEVVRFGEKNADARIVRGI